MIVAQHVNISEQQDFNVVGTRFKHQVVKSNVCLTQEMFHVKQPA